MGRVLKYQKNEKLRKILGGVSARVRHYREDLELSQSALAVRAGVSKSTLNEIENRGVGDLRLSTLCQLAEALECELADLIAPVAVELRTAERADLDEAVAEIARGFKALSRLHDRIK